jgi:hypothetical protein
VQIESQEILLKEGSEKSFFKKEGSLNRTLYTVKNYMYLPQERGIKKKDQHFSGKRDHLTLSL